jgi:RNA polymerase sigma-70 factor (ECF subfamily)
MLTEEQYTQAVKKNMDTVFRVAVNYLRDSETAEDVCQEVFLRLFRCRKDFSGEDHIRNWLIHVCINECKRSAASLWRQTESLDEIPDQNLFTEQEDNSTFQLVMSLPRKYRVVLYLHYYEGYSTEEIAKLLHILPSTVRSQLARGREQLKQMLLEAENV